MMPLWPVSEKLRLRVATLGQVWPNVRFLSQERNVCPHLVGALNTPDVGALPPQITAFAVIISILLFQKLSDKQKKQNKITQADHHSV